MISPLYASFIDGNIAEDARNVFDLIAPQDGKIVGRIAEAGQPGVDKAVAAASAAFAGHRKQPTHVRIGWLKAAAKALLQTSDDIAAIICTDVGKPIRMASFEVRRGAEFLEATAAALTQFGGETVPLDVTPAGANHFGFVRHIPYGVVAGITPFNAPVNLLVQKVAPAIAAGNAIVVKPAPAGTRTALKLAQLFLDAGWPENLFTVVTGDKETAAALAAHEGVRAVSFTGSTSGGEALARAAGAKKFLAELGSNAANIVLDDADVTVAAKKIASAAFEASGQQCISAQRILVARSRLGEFLDAFVQAAKSLKVGEATEPTTDVGPMVSAAAAERVTVMCADAIAHGARYALEPTRKGAVVSPGILVDVSSNARLWREEVFGPVAVVASFEQIDEALALANDSPFGLQGAVFTRDLGAVLRFADDFDVGALWINEATRFRLDNYPFGGVKQSGVGREGVRHAIEELSQLRFVGMTI
ncbi:aldehyde dehydrogenase family protein [Bradyrhizobium sp. CCGB12]|uniref:aldehyde dehydrogenase family protein n=1 Tax=Bradyrhizobium sp. CCGB12 TaxID=2949632 RepID=UPI0020B22A66|nr:aldehyde dehydrogenase family protein [Bradyrhizobium sp. CCGB12]MCP3395328.1 aldehyde dehydrogenase family protein [Bradyrhizobium sp. CCGB12]